MTMTPQEERLIDNLRLRLPGALDGVMQLELFNTVEKFFQQSSAWTEDVTFATVVGQTTYPLATTQGTILRLDNLVFDDGSNASIACDMPEPGTIELMLAPAAIYQLKATFILGPALEDISADGMPDVPDWLYPKYYDAIFNGVLAQMMSQPAKPYSNLNLAKLHAAMFSRGANQANNEASHGNVQRGQNWRFPSAGIPRRQRR